MGREGRVRAEMWEVESERGIEKEQGEGESVGGRERGWRG